MLKINTITSAVVLIRMDYTVLSNHKQVALYIIDLFVIAAIVILRCIVVE